MPALDPFSAFPTSHVQKLYWKYNYSTLYAILLPVFIGIKRVKSLYYIYLATCADQM